MGSRGGADSGAAARRVRMVYPLGVPAVQPIAARSRDRPRRLGAAVGRPNEVWAGADVDNDGDIDLDSGMATTDPTVSLGETSALLLNGGEGDVRFERPGRVALGLVVPHAQPTSWDEGHMTAAVLDVDGDGWQDIYLGASDYPGNRGPLYRQTAPLAFEAVATSSSTTAATGSRSPTSTGMEPWTGSSATQKVFPYSPVAWLAHVFSGTSARRFLALGKRPPRVSP